MSTHLERAIEKIQVKQPVVEIDWTLHTLDDGNVISTQERVIKDVRRSIRLLLHKLRLIF
jgi:serine/threonine-protein phosphatase 2B catalytic subunit